MKKPLLLLPVGVLLSSCANELTVTEPSEITLVAGQVTVPSAGPETSTTATINLRRVNSHGEDVTLSVTGMPQGLSAVFEKSTLSASETTAKLRLQAINVRPDVYMLTVSASSLSAKASTTLRVIVVGVDPINIPINTASVSTVMASLRASR